MDNIEAVVAACGGAGLAEYRPIVELEAGPMKGTKVVYMRDPDGLTFEFIEWAKQDG